MDCPWHVHWQRCTTVACSWRLCRQFIHDDVPPDLARQAARIHQADRRRGYNANRTSKIEFVHDESRPTILIVEDNKEMAVFIADEVNQLYNVEIAGNGAEAITLLKKHSIQLIISDVMMPVMDGFAL